MSPAVVPVLAKRSEGDIEKARRLLVPSCSSLPDPAGLPGMRAAARRLIEAIARNEPMVVYSDFDADGVTGAVVIKKPLISQALKAYRCTFLPVLKKVTDFMPLP